MREPSTLDTGHEPADAGRTDDAERHLVDRESAWSAAGTRTRTDPPSRGSDVFRCALHGEVDFSCRPQLDEMALAFAQSPCPTARVDVSDVTFVDSSALALLLGMRSVAADRGGRVVLVAPGRRLRRLLTIAGVSHLFGVAEPPEV